MNKTMPKLRKLWKLKAGSPLILFSVWLLVSFTVTLFVPGLIVKKARHDAPPAGSTVPSRLSGPAAPDAEVTVPVFMTRKQETERVPLEDYVRGVVAAEMPIEFAPEALKAQAMAARTYIVRRMADGDTTNVPAKDALVTDTITHQAYSTLDRLQAEWGDAYARNLAKVTQAVSQTAGLILTYQHKPIEADFFSTSNGYTENAEDYWGLAIPYLHSVPSPWDQALSPKFKATVEIPYREIASKLGLIPPRSAATLVAGVKVLEVSAGHRIEKIRIAGKTFTGREVREKLGLNSSQFTFQQKGPAIAITTTGYGHGVGMSQWGAEGMAEAGKTAADIVKYYYTGVTIESDVSYLPQK